MSLENKKYEEIEECSVCLENIKNIVIYDCGHYICKGCFKNCLKFNNSENFNCQLCRSKINKCMSDSMVIKIEDSIVPQISRKDRFYISLKKFLSFVAEISIYIFFCVCFLCLLLFITNLILFYSR